MACAWRVGSGWQGRREGEGHGQGVPVCGRSSPARRPPLLFTWARGSEAGSKHTAGERAGSRGAREQGVQRCGRGSERGDALVCGVCALVLAARQATALARAMVTKYGFSLRLGQVALDYEDEGRSMSSETRSIVEEEVKALVQVRGAGGGPQHELGDAQHRGGGGQGAGAGAGGGWGAAA